MASHKSSDGSGDKSGKIRKFFRNYEITIFLRIINFSASEKLLQDPTALAAVIKDLQDNQNPDFLSR